MSLDSRQLRLIFSEILCGFTHFPLTGFGPIYIKHLNNLDLADIDYWHNYYLEKYIKEDKLPTYDEKVEYLIKESLWLKKEEEKLQDYKKLLSQYEINKSNEYLKSKRDMWAAQIGPLEKDIKVLETKKNSMIGDTADSFASKKSNELHILKSFYKNKELTTPLFNQEDFDELDKERMDILYDIFNDYMKKFNQENLKRISLSNFFSNMFYLAENSMMEFYGKAIIYLSFYQIDLASFGRYFKSVLEEMNDKIPKDIRNDPNKILEFVELNRNYKKMFPDEKENEHQSLMGANKEDLKLLGMSPQSSEQLKKNLKKDMEFKA